MFDLNDTWTRLLRRKDITGGYIEERSSRNGLVRCGPIAAVSIEEDHYLTFKTSWTAGAPLRDMQPAPPWSALPQTTFAYDLWDGMKRPYLQGYQVTFRAPHGDHVCIHTVAGWKLHDYEVIRL